MEGLTFLQVATSPLVCISTSPNIKNIVKKNNFNDFTDFIRPFGERINNGKNESMNIMRYSIIYYL